MAIAHARLHAERPRSSRGFSLVELITVMVILGVLSVSVLPRWFKADDFKARGYFDQILQATRYAQKLAVVTHCDVTVTLSGNTLSLSMPAVAGCTAVPNVEVPGGLAAPPSGITLSNATITFHAFGNATITGTMPVVVSGGSSALSFQVIPATGYVQRL